MRKLPGSGEGAERRGRSVAETSSNAAFPGTAESRWEMQGGAEYPCLSAKQKTPVKGVFLFGSKIGHEKAAGFR